MDANAVAPPEQFIEHYDLDPHVLDLLLESEYSRQQLEHDRNLLETKMAQLADTMRQKEEAAQSKSEFLATMSHEIRTPLNGIMGMTSVLLERALGATEREYVETIRSSGEALMSLIDGVLELSKIEAGRLELESLTFSPANVIADTVRMVAPAAVAKSLTVTTVVDPAIPELVRGDMARLRRVLSNLLSNAVQFTDAGTVEARAELLGRTNARYHLRFSVRDEGVGISEEEQLRLFQPFAHTSAAGSQEHSGTGLGLAICKQLVELMGGRIGVESRPGQGSLFWFTVYVLASEPRNGPHATTRDRAAKRVQYSSARILLVDDNAVNQKVASLMLKKLGYIADLATNGAMALEMLNSKDYDMIFMDCRMPGMDGFEAARRIRNQGGRNAQTPIVAITANAFAEDRRACLEAGMSDYVAKPIRESALEETLNRWLPALH
jgi:signal transduction histidine kinase/CheY-like chemotaxis protein